MANVQNTQFDKFKRHLVKKVKILLTGLHPDKITGRFVGPLVILNSIPKAGTHMLESMLEEIPHLRNAGMQTLSCWDEIDNRLLRKVSRIGHGEFATAHLTALPAVVDIVQERKIKVIYLIRDPRDVIISFAKYVTEIDKTHIAHRYLTSLADEASVINACIIGGHPGIPRIDELLERFSSWERLDNTLSCRFESLVGQAGGGSSERQRETIIDILEHLDVKPDDKVVKSMENALTTKPTSTFRKGKIGNWQQHFNEGHKAIFKEYAGDWLIKYEYENDKSW